MIRAISAAITMLALAAGAAIFFSGAVPAHAAYPKKDATGCTPSSYCKHRAAEVESVDTRRQ